MRSAEAGTRLKHHPRYYGEGAARGYPSSRDGFRPVTWLVNIQKVTGLANRLGRMGERALASLIFMSQSFAIVRVLVRVCAASGKLLRGSDSASAFEK